MYTTIISGPDLKEHLSKDWVVFDCRFNLADTSAGEAAYIAGHIPGATYLHLDNDLSSKITPESGRHPLPDMEQLVSRLAKAGVSNNSQVIVYDDCGGAMAARAWWLLGCLGHKKVAVLDGGYAAWLNAGGEESQFREPGTEGDLSGQFQPEYSLTVDQLQTELSQNSISLVDARGEERFRGEVEPIDPVAGHIPGAVNRPLTDNLDQGVFKSPDRLRAEWQSIIGDLAPSHVVHMCGSGITACHNQLAMTIAGLKGSRIYAGSWSEWIRNPERPVAKN